MPHEFKRRTTMTPKEVIELAKKNDVKFVDLKFIDLPGIWQRASIPRHSMGSIKSSERASIAWLKPAERPLARLLTFCPEWPMAI